MKVANECHDSLRFGRFFYRYRNKKIPLPYMNRFSDYFPLTLDIFYIPLNVPLLTNLTIVH